LSTIEDLMVDFFDNEDYSLRSTAGLHVVRHRYEYVVFFLNSNTLSKKNYDIYNSDEFDFNTNFIKKHSLCYSIFNERVEKLKKLI